MNPSIVPLPMELRSAEHRALASVWWTGMLMKRAFREAFGQQFRSEAQFNALRVLASAEAPLTQTDIAGKLMTDKANVSGLLNSMQAAGLVERRPVEGDRRSNHVVLTAKGRRLAAEAGEAYDKKVRVAMAGLTNAEQEQLVRLTRKVREGLVSLVG
jgi:DNA-binding MarR family transcriptional regulator